MDRINKNMEPTEKKSNGALIGSIVIIIILIIGGIYIWQSKVKTTLEQKDQYPGTISEEANALNSLEQDLNDIETDIDVDVNNIE